MDKKKRKRVAIPQGARLLNLPQAARYLGVGPWVLRRKVWAGELPFVQDKKGAWLQFDREDLDRYIQTHKRTN